MPASADADKTTPQLTPLITADVPIVATAVCAMVFKARMLAAFAALIDLNEQTVYKRLNRLKKKIKNILG